MHVVMILRRCYRCFRDRSYLSVRRSGFRTITRAKGDVTPTGASLKPVALAAVLWVSRKSCGRNVIHSQYCALKKVSIMSPGSPMARARRTPATQSADTA
jgi:hypothetical protein